MDDELLDLVNEYDEVIDVMQRSKVHALQLKNFRVINAFIKRSDGKFWIPRRTKQKSIFPLGLDFSVAGHVSRGESYEEAFQRETYEEVGIDIRNVSYKELGSLNPYENIVHAFMHIYEIEFDEVPVYNRDDFIEYFYLSPEELKEKIIRGEYAKDDILPVLEKVYHI